MSEPGRWRQFAAAHPDVVAAAIVAAVTLLVRLPFRLDGLGEHDQARFLVDAILYRYEGADIFRKYFIHTSPLALLLFAIADRVVSHAALLPLSNALAVTATCVTAAAAYVYVNDMVKDRRWAGAIAIGATLVPGIFMTSLYGYPSVYALACLTVGAAALQRAVRAQGRRHGALLSLAGASYIFAVLLKVDFALMGSWYAAIVFTSAPAGARLRGVVNLVALALAAAALAVGLAFFMSAGQLGTGFALSWYRDYAPFVSGEFDLGSIAYATGFGTLLLLLSSMLLGAVRGGADIMRLMMGWLLAVVPLWLFWAAVPPLSTRHCLPGALVTAIVAGVAAARAAPNLRRFAPAWPLLLVVSNWFVGTPGVDVNYKLSGDLAGNFRNSRAAFGAAQQVVDDIMAADASCYVVLHLTASPQVLDGIDIMPLFRYELAKSGAFVSNQEHPRSPYHLRVQEDYGDEVVFIESRGWRPDRFINRLKLAPEDCYFFSMRDSTDEWTARRGVVLHHYDLLATLQRPRRALTSLLASATLRRCRHRSASYGRPRSVGRLRRGVVPLPYDIARPRDLERAAALAVGDERVAVAQPLDRPANFAEERSRRLAAKLPFDFACKTDRLRSRATTCASVVVENENAAVRLKGWLVRMLPHLVRTH